MNARVHMWVSGVVQGVFFRRSTQEEARRLGVVGWVRNLPDRRVEIVAEGAKETLEQLVAWTHHGPPHAHVTDVECQWAEAQDEFTQFEIRYDR